jgi:hypothetical protein
MKKKEKKLGNHRKMKLYRETLRYLDDPQAFKEVHGGEGATTTTGGTACSCNVLACNWR